MRVIKSQKTNKNTNQTKKTKNTKIKYYTGTCRCSKNKIGAWWRWGLRTIKSDSNLATCEKPSEYECDKITKNQTKIKILIKTKIIIKILVAKTKSRHEEEKVTELRKVNII